MHIKCSDISFGTQSSVSWLFSHFERDWVLRYCHISCKILCTVYNGYYNAGLILVLCRHKGVGDTKWMWRSSTGPHTMCDSRKELSLWAGMKVIWDWHSLQCSPFTQPSLLPLWLSSSHASLQRSLWVSGSWLLQNCWLLFWAGFHHPGQVLSLLAFQRAFLHSTSLMTLQAFKTGRYRSQNLNFCLANNSPSSSKRDIWCCIHWLPPLEN